MDGSQRQRTGVRLLIGENRFPILETRQLSDAIFTTPMHAHTHLPAPQQSTPVGQQRHLVENQVVTLSPAQLGQPRSSRTQVSPPAQFLDQKALHSLTSRGKQSNISCISICQLVHLFNFLFFFFFTSFLFLEYRKRKKISFIFTFY